MPIQIVNSGVDLSDKEGRQVATRTMYRTRLNTDEELAEEQGHKPESAPLSPRRSLQDADAAKANNFCGDVVYMGVLLDKLGFDEHTAMTMKSMGGAEGEGEGERHGETRAVIQICENLVLHGEFGSARLAAQALCRVGTVAKAWHSASHNLRA